MAGPFCMNEKRNGERAFALHESNQSCNCVTTSQALEKASDLGGSEWRQAGHVSCSVARSTALTRTATATATATPYYHACLLPAPRADCKRVEQVPAKVFAHSR